MADTIEELILQNIKTALVGLATLKTVERDRLSPLDIQSYPAAILMDLGTAPEGIPTQVTRLELNVLVEVWVKVEKNAAQTLMNLSGDVDKAVLADPRRGGKAQNTVFQGKDTVFAVANEPLRGVQLRYQIQFRHKTGDAYLAT